MKKIENHIRLLLKIKQNHDHSHSFQYLCRMENGVVVNLQGLVISEPTIMTVELDSATSTNFDITQCLIPCGQKTLTAEIKEVDGQKLVVLVDKDNEEKPEEYNFIIIAVNQHTSKQVVCDPQIRNKGTMISSI